MDSRGACPSLLPVELWGLQMRRERPILVYLLATSGKRERFHKKETVDEEASVQFGTSPSSLENHVRTWTLGCEQAARSRCVAKKH